MIRRCVNIIAFLLVLVIVAAIGPPAFDMNEQEREFPKRRCER